MDLEQEIFAIRIGPLQGSISKLQRSEISLIRAKFLAQKMNGLLKFLEEATRFSFSSEENETVFQTAQFYSHQGYVC